VAWRSSIGANSLDEGHRTADSITATSRGAGILSLVHNDDALRWARAEFVVLIFGLGLLFAGIRRRTLGN